MARLLKKSKLLLYFILILGITSLSVSKREKRNDKFLTYSIKMLWNIDSCGSLNYRDSISSYLFKSQFLLNKDSVYVRYLFGNPDIRFIDEDDGEIWYVYFKRCWQDPKTGYCVRNMELCPSTIEVFFNKKNKVKNFIIPIH